MERSVQMRRIKEKRCPLTRAKQLGFRLLITFAVTVMISLVLIPLAYAERGYIAIGGEWLGVIMTAFMSFPITKKMRF